MMSRLISSFHDFLWGWPLIIALFGTHIFMTIRTGFIQKDVFKAIKMSVTKDKDSQGDISQFGALTTALSSTIGTGNIIGVGTAIALGGPGSVLWMWLTGVFGMATKYAETLIAVKYRVKSSDGSMIGGAMYALDRGLHKKWLGILFAAFTALAGFGIGCLVQANAVATTIQNYFDVPSAVIGIVLTIIVGMVILGGIQSISKVAEKLVPFMAIFYVAGCLLILIMNVRAVPGAIALIWKAAFSARTAGGGFVGSTIATVCRYGFARGLFSNESGMGSSPLIASAAQTKNPKRQALVSMTATFWDTVVICFITGLVLVTSIMIHPEITSVDMNGSVLTTQAFSKIPYVGEPVLVVGLVTFAFSTILGWYYYGERCSIYLFGEKAIKVYKLLWVGSVFFGALIELDVIWNIADILNGLMAIPNMIAVIGLSGVIASETKKYSGTHIEDVDDTELPTVENTERGILR